jgi:hypothetical protein
LVGVKVGNILYLLTIYVFSHPAYLRNMNKMLWSLCGAGLLLSLATCQSDKKCKYKPTPVFEKQLPHIVQYNFEQQGTQSLESVLLDTKVLLEIHQDVCDQTRQEYRFIVKGDYSAFPDSLWQKEAVRQLVFLSTFSPKQASLKDWADIIEQRRRDMRLGEDYVVQSGISIRIDRVLSKEQSTLLVVFKQE